MRTLLICHELAPLDRDGLARWLGSFSTLAGIVVIREPGRRRWERVRREVRRNGYRRFLDVAAFRAWHAIAQKHRDATWERDMLERLCTAFPARQDEVAAPELMVSTPNAAEARAFIEQQAPDLVIARCKTLLREDIFSIPRLGTFVLHPGICPEYRNAHGCFWAMARGDWHNVGLTLLKIDRGIDTGPVFGYFRVGDGFERDSHIVIQQRALFEHLDEVRDTFLDIASGRATPIDTSKRASAVWGQPWLTAFLRMKVQLASEQRRVQAGDAAAK